MQDPEIEKLNVKLDAFNTTLQNIAKDVSLIKNDFHHEIKNLKEDVAYLMEKDEKQSDKKDNRGYDTIKAIILIFLTVGLTQTVNYLIGGKKDDTTVEVVKTLRNISETMEKINRNINEKGNSK